MEVGSPDEGPIGSFVTVGSRLLIVKSTAIYEVKMADSVDPGRTNPKIPNTQQRLLPMGSESPLLGRTLLTAHALFDKSRLPRINTSEAVEWSLNAATDLSAMQDALDRLVAKQDEIAANLEGQKLTDGFIMPAIGNLVPESKSFLQKADHLLQALLDIARLFYPDVTHADSLLRVARREGLHERTIEFLESVTPSMRFIREARNAIEHPKADKRLEIKDYSLRPDGNVEGPTIEMIHLDMPEPPMPVSVFMRDIIEKLSIIFEMVLVHLCFHHAECGEYSVAIILLPEEKRGTPHVRYTYALRMGDEWVPIG